MLRVMGDGLILKAIHVNKIICLTGKEKRRLEEIPCRFTSLTGEDKETSTHFHMERIYNSRLMNIYT